MNKFKAGDVVELRSGSVKMTVYGMQKSSDGWYVAELAYWCEKDEEFKNVHAAVDLLMLSEQ